MQPFLYRWRLNGMVSWRLNRVRLREALSMSFLLVWGSRRKNTLIGYTDDNHQCFHCDAIGSQPVFQTVEQGTLFYIPLPIKRTRYFLKCKVRGCDGITDITKDEADQLLTTYA